MAQPSPDSDLPNNPDHDANEQNSTVSNNKRIMFISLALIAGITIGFTISECTLRLLEIKPERYAPPQWHVFMDNSYRSTPSMWGDGLIKKTSRFANQGVVMGEYVPNSKFKVTYSSNPRGYFDADNGVIFKINSLGLRGPEVTENKPSNTLRILGLGDSFAFGEGVRDEDTFLRRLEHSLNANPVNGALVEVLNAGTQGYNSRDEVLYLEHRWLKLAPDVVLISFYLNDAYTDDTFWIRGEGLGIYLAEPQGLAQYSYVIDLIKHEYGARKIRRSMQTYYSHAYFSQPQRSFRPIGGVNADWHASRTALEHAVKLSHAKGFKIALVIFPEFQALDKEYPFEQIHSLVKNSCTSFGMPVLDLLDTYRGYVDRDLWVHPSDHHPNEIAHKMAADAIDVFLRQNILDTE